MSFPIKFCLVFLAFGATGLDSDPVKIVGSLKKMMHEGDLTAKIKISKLGDLKNVYGLGAEAGLKGEIIIDGNQAWVGRVAGDDTSVESGADAEAALLVYAQVPEWHWVDIPAEIVNNETLQQFIQRAATLYGLKTDEPIPFLLQGKAAILKWHVIEWPEGRQDHSPQTHRNSGLHGTVADQEVAIVGFYSEHHQGIFTHHGSNLHMHVRFPNDALVAHVDNLNPGGLRLALPASDISM